MSLRDKYDIDHPWVDSCVVCGEPVVMTAARWEVLGTYHDGCFGYPVCSCADSHQGECDAPFNVIKLRQVVAPAKDLGTDAKVLPFVNANGSALWRFSSNSSTLTMEMIQQAYDSLVERYVKPDQDPLAFMSHELRALYEECVRGQGVRARLRLAPKEE